MIGQKLQAQDKSYHPYCFTCDKCKGSLEHEAFVPHEGKVYHNKCYVQDFAKLCAQCGGYIEDSYMENGDDMIHEKCIEKYKKSKGYA